MPCKSHRNGHGGEVIFMEIMEGSRAVAEAVKACRPNVIAAYPITPQTHIVEEISRMVADGELVSEYVRVESEHSAMSVCVGASATGARTYTATTSQGMALMHEVLFNAAGLRLPIVMTAANRSLSAPINIWNDHQDMISERDSGWIQLYSEDAQEASDMIIQAYKIAEDHDILLPVMIGMDGFILTHVHEPVELCSQEKVDDFLPLYDPIQYLTTENPLSFGTIVYPNTYTEFRYMIHEAMKKAERKIVDVASEFQDKFGRYYGGLIDTYEADDADLLILAMGSVIGTAKDAVDELRSEGKKVGIVKVRCYRPFPAEAIVESTKDAKAIAVLDKNISLGYEGALYTDVKSALYGKNGPLAMGFVLGLGGRDINKKTIKNIVAKADKAIKSGIFEAETEFVDLDLEVL
ncbi:MAG: pyruvate ferredoxin oxidoreductase [Methanocellales archaeon]|nr:pyruvate ferredoxin oxidoreductase [Methanocellales archaeon]